MGRSHLGDRHIIAQMQPDWVQPYIGGLIPVVIESTHPDYKPGRRFDYGFLQVALGQNYNVLILAGAKQ